jgi:hypothetical protein
VSSEPEPDPQPPAASAVARRALILAALTCRGHLESSLDEPASRALHARILTWLETAGLLEDLEPEEQGIFHTAKGDLKEQQRLAAVGAIEGAAILAWALGKYPLPPMDVLVEPFKVGDALGFLWEGAVDLIRYAKLRSPAELSALHGLATAVSARLQEVEAHPVRPDFAAGIPAAWLRLLGLYRHSPLLHGDLALSGHPVHLVDPQQRRAVAEVAGERARAASWLLGARSRYWG